MYSLTTAINYANGKPHLGHLYEIVVADCLARYHRQSKEVYFLTGSDEHGQKIKESSEKNNLSPIDFCNLYVEKFQKMNKHLNISNDFYIRTTSPEHKLRAQEFFIKCANNDDIYYGSYHGWYSIREERFLSDAEASKANYMDKDVPLSKMAEYSYFFRLSRYQTQLIELLKTNFIYPEELKTHMLQRLEEPLKDLSISRTSFDWGIDLPEEFKGKNHPGDEKHVMYVWFDALTNYLQAPSGYVHLIGKDIVWFHAIIWPAMLMSAGLPLPQKIVCHGFINDDKGLKMSKSWGNVIDPEDLFKKYSSDVLRYYLLSEGSFSQDINFDEKRIIQRYNGELAHNLGNLVQRVLPLVVKYCDGVVDLTTENILNHELLNKDIVNNYEEYNFSKVLSLIFNAFSEINIWLTKKEPWKNPSPEERRYIVSCVVNNFVKVLIHLEPFMPSICNEISSRFALKKEKDCYLITSGKVSIGEPLFPKL